MKFDYIIGNPPYQDEIKGTTKTATPIYHYFIDETQKVGSTVELIHPARFLFNAGGTPKAWNSKMLNDPHFKILEYEKDCTKVFDNVDIKGGVVISYWDKNRFFEPIEVFSVYPELNSILKKVKSLNPRSLSEIITNRGLYRYSDLAYKEQPLINQNTTDKRIAPSSFSRMPTLFTEEKPENHYEYVKLLGNIKGKRVYRWFRRDYIEDNQNIDKYKVLIPKASGTGEFGEVLAEPVIAEPFTGFTETYLSVGCLDDVKEAESIYKYIKGKFARALLGILKVTQNNPKQTWEKVPLEDFSRTSDINWSLNISEIDQQLYKKYNLSEEEIEFIETNVQEME